MLDWLNEKAPWAAFIVLSVMGGIVAHIRMFEQMKVDMTPIQHLWSISRRATMAAFAGLLVYFAADGWGARASPWSFIAAGICGMFAAEFFDLLWRLGSAYVQGRVKITEPKP